MTDTCAKILTVWNIGTKYWCIAVGKRFYRVEGPGMIFSNGTKYYNKLINDD